MDSHELTINVPSKERLVKVCKQALDDYVRIMDRWHDPVWVDQADYIADRLLEELKRQV